MKRFLLAWGMVALFLVGKPTAAADSFQQAIQPLLNEYCVTCHSTQEMKGDLDLERFASIDDVRNAAKVWESVLEQLENNEMPPKEAVLLSPERKSHFMNWVQTTLDEVALANAGDPGPVVLRRLSNAEYAYTIRDLTGVPSLDPTKEFPVDGAAGEGFTNASAGLVMSPSLLTKYLDAAKEIAGHAVLLPDGIRFSPSTSARDWSDETLAMIREFYTHFTESSGATAVNLQGIQFDTNGGGRLPLERYVSALLAERAALHAGKSLAEVAKSYDLNAKYLATLWDALHDTRESLILDRIRQAFQSAATNEAEQVTQLIRDWQNSLWRFSSVGHIGKVNSPQSWQEPVTPLIAQQEIRLKLSPSADGSDLRLYLTALDAGDGSEYDYAVWENARIVAAGRPDLPVKDVLDSSIFGKHPDGSPVDANSLCVKAPMIIELSLPSELAENAELIVTGRLHPSSGGEGSVQMQILTSRPAKLSGMAVSNTETAVVAGQWSDNNLRTHFSTPVIVNDGGPARRRIEAAFDDFRSLFPIALCYPTIVPVDEVVTLTLFYREDDQLRRLMLDEGQTKRLDQLWDQLRFVSQSPLKQVDGFEQLYQFATQDANPSAFEPMREPIMHDAEVFKQQLLDNEPVQIQAVLDFACLAWRRPLTEREQTDLRSMVASLRSQGLPHPGAVRALLARVLVSPAFLYRSEKATRGDKPFRLSDWELATRLSYFLWSSTPDDELRGLAAAGKLRDPDVLSAQATRMLKDSKVRRLATEFGCQWLQVRDLETLDEKSERHFPTFLALRGAMQEECVRFLMDMFQEDRSVLSLIDSDHSFVNGALAEHYAIEVQGNEWQHVDGLRAHGRGGMLAFASTLAKQSGASRTSPILRGNWLSEVVLGEKLPRPPKGVPVLPEEAPSGLTERQLTERHSSDPSCAHCHQRIDPFGFALEGFDAIGRSRSLDANGLTIDTRTQLPNGDSLEGLEGLKSYLLTQRRDDFLRQFCRKLLGYALGRSVQLSDKPLIDSMLTQLNSNQHRVHAVVECIVRSPQFRELRGLDFLTSN